MTDKQFLEANRRELTKQYRDYVESILADGQEDEMEDFPTWLTEEHALAKEYAKAGTPLNGYAL